MEIQSPDIVSSGLSLSQATKVIIMVHGRGASPESIISLKEHLKLEDAAIVAPRAKNSSWYPYNFMAPVEQNQPALDSSLKLVRYLVTELLSEGIHPYQLYFLGFSQGACLVLEYVARYAEAFGGVIAFTGGLIGESLTHENYSGDFQSTPLLITTGDPDPHVPLSRVEESVNVFKTLNADVHLKVYPGRMHTILMEEIELANQLILTNR
jgi:phospholipase/carboxylesterase